MSHIKEQPKKANRKVMPKELIHFKTALRTATGVADPQLSAVLSTHTHGLLLGSIIHDAFFYGIHRQGHTFQHLAHAFHGIDGQDTFTLLKLQAEHVRSTPHTELATALFIGMASHIFADATMHPMVWYLSGDYFAPTPKARSLARQRHRALESLMDMLICPEMVGRPLFSIAHLLKRTGEALYQAVPIHQLAMMSKCSANELQAGLKQALTIFATLQKFNSRQWLARPLYATTPFLPRQAREIIALFHAPQLLRQADTLRNAITYQHPVSGLMYTESIETMIDKAVTRTLAVCDTDTPSSSSDWSPLFTEKGPSLETGENASSTQDMRHFATPPFPQLP
ncbi:hypothetical protein GO013_00465 [Pseudodesulfovibrio sp. JC047]|uniref:zinc dependent phospholipase C family protein n=1 Tax=Pseudodesulfovibrio sp. JC047 TaxID=2683199 RepID=UPI0013D4955F|nr:zinc dependent phospholipase C family protein [Pseudodesulfovibrio sp. JC047]NDV17890.1 hypothetical protein [Pseudodesulfovibrio sp. JC047]